MKTTYLCFFIVLWIVYSAHLTFTMVYQKKGVQREYTEQDRQNILKAVKKGTKNGKTKKEICAQFNIPTSTLHRWETYNKKCVLGTGNSNVFSVHEENLISLYLIYPAKYGFPQDIRKLQMMVKSFLIYFKKKNPFKNGVPGKKMAQKF